MKVALAHNHFDAAHLTDIMSKMQKLGPPKIRVCHVDADLFQAIEGCHRLRAAAALGITPNFEYLDRETLRSDVEGLDYHDGNENNEESTVGGIGDWENDTLQFEDC